VKSLLGRFPIGVRLGLGFALILVLMAVIAAVALFSSTQARRQLNDTVDRVIAKSAAVASMRTSLFQQGLLARNIGMSTDPAAMQKDNSTSDMIWNCEELVSRISQFMTLNKGDVILTGTPEGVGPMIDGDVVECGVEGIGDLKMTCRNEKVA